MSKECLPKGGRCPKNVCQRRGDVQRMFAKGGKMSKEPLPSEGRCPKNRLPKEGRNHPRRDLFETEKLKGMEGN